VYHDVTRQIIYASIPRECEKIQAKMLLFHFTLLVSCYHVMSQPDDKCKFVNFSCEAGLSKTSQEFSLIEICDPLLDPAVAGRCNFIHSGGRPVGFKC